MENTLSSISTARRCHYFTLESQRTQRLPGLRALCELSHFAFCKEQQTRVQGRSGQTYGRVSGTMLPLSLIPLWLVRRGQRSRKVFPLPLITTPFSHVRGSRAAPFIPHRPPPRARLSHFKPRSPSSAFLIDLFCFAPAPAPLFSLRQGGGYHGEWRGNKKTCARLFVMHKQEVG